MTEFRHYSYSESWPFRFVRNLNLNQVTIYSDKPIETVEFFELLGLKRIVDSLPRYARLECGEGGSTLSVNEFPEHTLINNVVLYLECDVDVEYERLMALGLEFTQPPTDRSWLWREAYLLDPNGNKICLYHAGKNRLDPPWRIK